MNIVKMLTKEAIEGGKSAGCYDKAVGNIMKNPIKGLTDLGKCMTGIAITKKRKRK